MGFRFRKSIKVLPGVRVNLGKSGVTGVNVGKRGAVSVSAGRDGSHLNVGTPIAGLNYRERIDGEPTPVAPASSGSAGAGIFVAIVGALAAVVTALVKAMLGTGGGRRRR